MRECKKCGHVIPKDTYFCRNCGEPSGTEPIDPTFKKKEIPKEKLIITSKDRIEANKKSKTTSKTKESLEPKKETPSKIPRGLSSKSRLCPHCGSDIHEDSLYCRNCHKSVKPKKSSKSANLIDVIPEKEEVKEEPQKKKGFLAGLFGGASKKESRDEEPLKPGEKRCPNCGAPMLLSSDFCVNCGVNVSKVAQKAPLKEPVIRHGIISPHLKKKKTTTISSIVILALLVILLLAAISIYYTLFGEAPKDECYEHWVCDAWSECENNHKLRACTEVSNCGTEEFKPFENLSCESSINETENISLCSDFGSLCEVVEDCCRGYCVNGKCQKQKPCTPIGLYCDKSGDCCDKHCVHHACRENKTYCGDGYCDMGEDCTSCSYDCGACPQDRDLKQNVFTEPINYFENTEYLENGYVTVRYFYSLSCDYCYSPAHIENQLREVAPQLKDIMVLELIDAYKEPFESNKYATIGDYLYTPLIRIEGISNNQTKVYTLYGPELGDMLVDGDITVDVAELICKSSDYCDFVDNRIVKTYSHS